MANRSERVSPTAYATGAFWVRHGLSDARLATPRGRRLERAFNLLSETLRRTTGQSLSAMLLARHAAIDAQLEAAIDDGRITQVIELAAGLSGRGLRFVQRYGNAITYVESDLPHMVAEKRRLLGRQHARSAHHRLTVIDALQSGGPTSLAAVAGTLDAAQGTAIITEGLMNYLPPAAAGGLWQRIGDTLNRFPRGLYLSDVYLLDANRNLAMAALGAVLMGFVRSRLHVHFRDAEAALAQMHRVGLPKAAVHRMSELSKPHALAQARGAARVQVLEAQTP